MYKQYSGYVVTLGFLIFLGAVRATAADVTAANVELTPTEKEMIDWVDARSDELLLELTEHVGINTGTDNVPGLDRYRNLLAAELADLGFATQTFSSPPQPVLTCDGGSVAVADHLVASREGSSSRRILLNGHMDTVFSASDNFQSLTVTPDGTLHGPGVADMKGGIVIMLNALRALAAVGKLDDATITILLNSDEEIGSLGSRALIEELAREHDIGLVFEGTKDDRMTRARKGLGQARFKVTGRESHAGGSHEKGVSANLGLAHQVVAIEALTDYERGTTVNVGVMRGGEKRNTVPGCADAYVDLRYPTVEDGEYLLSALDEIAATSHVEYPNYPTLPSTEVWGVLHRPVKPENAEVDAIIAEAMGLSLLIGEPVVGTAFSGGGTDGSIAQAAGLPTADSMGIDGSGAHSSRERASLQSLIARTKLAAVMIGRQIEMGQ